MKKFPIWLILFGLLIGCEEKGTELEAGQEWAHLTGTVKYAENLQPVYMAFVRTQTHLETATTDSSGQYDLAIALPKDEQETADLEIYKEGYLTINLPVVISAGETTPVPTLTLERYLDSTITDTTYTGSGPGESIIVVSVEQDTLSVAGAGGQTSSQIICEVQDASGNPVDSLHATQLLFELIEDPSGGAHIYPTTDVTDYLGRVSTTFFSGTNAGMVIIKAQFADGSTYIILPEILIYQTGDPASIMLVDLEYDSVAVQGTGANEASTATFVVKDAGGSPISSQQPTAINFAIMDTLGGGEYLYPETDITNAQGQVSTTLNSGTVAGTIQLLAYLAEDSSVVCTPVPIAIHSGLPHPDHFGVYPQYLNFPGYNYYGLVDSIFAIVGDLMANPVPLGTSVYFSTDFGTIEGSATTCAAGFASVRLFSGPTSPPFNDPFGNITAQTVGEGGAILTDTTRVLFSGITQIYSVQPDTFDIAQGFSQYFIYYVSDQNGFPLSHDTHIEIEATAGGVMGDVNVLFPDTQSLDWIDFAFVLYDNDPEDTDPPVLAAVTITVTSANGNASYTFTGMID